ncbi:MAG: DUF4469 domain-containing protein [Treponema sp.]|jgi:hypothetical protein|nr:DUF4469 domain-containing protein [Treponema sp.]
MIDYYVVQNTAPADSTECHAVVTHTEGVNDESFITMLSEVLNVNKGEAKLVLSGVGTAARNLLSQGWAFKIEGIGGFSLRIGGSFEGPSAPFDHGRHKVSARFLPDKSLTAAARTAPLNRLRGVENGPVIDGVEDKAGGAPNSALTPGHGARLAGKSLKIAGEGAGIFIIDDSGDAVTVDPKDILENGRTKVLFICPSLEPGEYHLKVSTHFTSSGETAHLRSYTFDAPLAVSAPPKP